MSKTATVRVASATLLATLGLFAQSTPGALTWTKIGNELIDKALAALATGPVERVWYSADGRQLLVRTASGNVFTTSDFETWQPGTAALAAPVSRSGAVTIPEPGAVTRTARANSPRFYAFGRFVYKSDNNGASWDNLTAFRTSSIIGDGLWDLAVSPVNEDEAAVATASGVFRTVDGGKSWSGLNQGLPNLPSARLLSLPEGDQGARVGLLDSSVIEWQPGQKTAWIPGDNSSYIREFRLRQALTAMRGVKVTAVSWQGDMVYLGSGDGQLIASANRGQTYLPAFAVSGGGAVERFWTDPTDPRIAIAVLGASPAASAHVLRTINGGSVWDDMTGNLPNAAVRGVTADRASGAVYIATDQGVFYATADLATLGGNVAWTHLSGLPETPVADVMLDAGANQLWAALDGYGVYATLAPHRFRDPRVVSSADFVARAAAPGSLVSVAGAKVASAQAGSTPAAVLASTDTETQIQIPFEARGSSVSLAVSSTDGSRTLPAVALEAAAPAIFVARDGSPMLLDSETGMMLDAMTPAHSRGRIQILATGLGRVTPDWPTGIAGPVENPPKVAAAVTAYLDRQPVEVTKAVLAPYVGYYLVEIEIPKIVNYGPAELYIEASGQASNRVRVYIEP